MHSALLPPSHRKTQGCIRSIRHVDCVKHWATLETLRRVGGGWVLMVAVLIAVLIAVLVAVLVDILVERPNCYTMA